MIVFFSPSVLSSYGLPLPPTCLVLRSVKLAVILRLLYASAVSTPWLRTPAHQDDFQTEWHIGVNMRRALFIPCGKQTYHLAEGRATESREQARCMLTRAKVWDGQTWRPDTVHTLPLSSPWWWRQQAPLKSSVYFIETTRRSLPEGCHLHTRCRGNLMSHNRHVRPKH
jgi:hypothetical protein